MKRSNYLKLLGSILLDAIGCLTFIIPGVGEFGDIIWAPASVLIMTKLYSGRKGQIAGAISFVEEALPFVDVIPTFTLMWLYVNVFASEKPSDESDITINNDKTVQ